MNNQPTEQEIFSTLEGIIAGALRVKRERIVREALLFNDLGAESLDILDIRFQIERAFGFKIDQDAMLRAIGKDVSAQEIKARFNVGSLVHYIQQRLGATENAA
jgi:acyl carrier protein